VTAEARRRLLPAAPPRRWIAVGAAATVVLGASAMLVAREVVSPPPAPAQPPPARAAGDAVRFEDAAAGFSIVYPADWQRVVSPDPEIRLLVKGEGSSMLVRMADLGITIGPGDVGRARKITDALVRKAAGAELLRPPQRVTLGGLPGYLYLYPFTDPATGQQGGHAHYFLFRGRTLITLVFQTVPAERFADMAPRFDRMGETLRVAGQVP